ncbi:tRNA adenosine(34) deaminase TadA [Lampropedia cohaerens]|uniref:tRNA adenosine(34) deaminase TadA n=1 Tax=Lampropedia cohaerens TaxID=1610491 RepID=UPI00069CAA9A|nr:tRNA adenosine(34) deaminase TadA [Lampropedia cohaerens]
MLVADHPEDVRWMREAQSQARHAAALGEVPVGAVLVADGQVVARAGNRTRTLGDPTAHAEMLVLREGAALLGNHRLCGATLYVTLEPCAMCSGAIFQARLARVVYGAREPKTGAAGSVVDLFANHVLNHHTQVCAGVLAQECAQLLAEFFQSRRVEQAAVHQPLVDTALRTPERSLQGCPAAGAYFSRLSAAQGLRVHVQTGAAARLSSRHALLLLHPLWHWSAWWQPVLEQLHRLGVPVAAPDLPGWGRSDKPKKARWHTVARHVAILHGVTQALEVGEAVVVVPQHAMGLALALGEASTGKVAGVIALADGDAPQWPAPAGLLQRKAWPDALLQHLHPLRGDASGQPDRFPALAQALADAVAPFPDAGHAACWAAEGLAAELRAARQRFASTMVPVTTLALHTTQAVTHPEAYAAALRQHFLQITESRDAL